MKGEGVVLSKASGSELSKEYWFLHPLVRSHLIKADKKVGKERLEKIRGKWITKWM